MAPQTHPRDRPKVPRESRGPGEQKGLEAVGKTHPLTLKCSFVLSVTRTRYDGAQRSPLSLFRHYVYVYVLCWPPSAELCSQLAALSSKLALSVDVRTSCQQVCAEASSPSCQEFKQTVSRKFPLKWCRISQTSKISVKSFRSFSVKSRFEK